MDPYRRSRFSPPLRPPDEQGLRSQPNHPHHHPQGLSVHPKTDRQIPQRDLHTARHSVSSVTHRKREKNPTTPGSSPKDKPASPSKWECKSVQRSPADNQAVRSRRFFSVHRASTLDPCWSCTIKSRTHAARDALCHARTRRRARNTQQTRHASAPRAVTQQPCIGKKVPSQRCPRRAGRKPARLFLFCPQSNHNPLITNKITTSDPGPPRSDAPPKAPPDKRWASAHPPSETSY
jgi:hypothetical protein